MQTSATVTEGPIPYYPSLFLHDCMMSAAGVKNLATMDTLSLGDADVNIFVGNLAWTTTEQDLRQLFEPYGSVDTIRIMTDRETGRSRGFGFAEMPESRAAQSAIDALNGTPLAGRVLTVNEAKPREPKVSGPDCPVDVIWTAPDRSSRIIRRAHIHDRTIKLVDLSETNTIG